LAVEIAGQLITPDDAEYEAARGVCSGVIDRRPATHITRARIQSRMSSRAWRISAESSTHQNWYN
jgi:hypothetical protein